MVKKLVATSSLVVRNHKLQEKWGYIEDPTYSRSIGSHVCLTCSKFDYLSQESFVSILFCKWHQKLINHGQHITHSCDVYQKKVNFNINKKLNQRSKVVWQT